jgi:hypothetical protein
MPDLETRQLFAEFAGEPCSIEYRAVWALSSKDMSAAACSLLPKLAESMCAEEFDRFLSTFCCRIKPTRVGDLCALIANAVRRVKEMDHA